MADHFCPNCGTEVEEEARFCPTCGTTLASDSDASGPNLPPAPAWTERPQAEPESHADEAPAEPPAEEPAGAPAKVEPRPAPPGDESPTMTVAPPQATVPPSPDTEQAAAASSASQSPPPEAPPPPPAAQAPPAGDPAATPTRSMPDLPITWPTTMAGWLIGAGSLLGAIFLIASLGNVISLLLFLALLGIAATIFLSDRVPEIPRLRLAVLVITMIGLGVALARAGFTVRGLDTLFLLAMIAAAGGALLIELERDRPWPPPERSGG